MFRLRESLGERYALGSNEVRRVALDVPDVPPGPVWLEPAKSLQASPLSCPSGPFEVTERRTCEILLHNLSDEPQAVAKGLAVMQARAMTAEESVLADAFGAHELGDRSDGKDACLRQRCWDIRVAYGRTLHNGYTPHLDPSPHSCLYLSQD